MDSEPRTEMPEGSLNGNASPGTQMFSWAYQTEMFERSMERNVIVAMETGSGKTQIARLRMEAELERTPSKRVWFCAPKVELAQQQFNFLSGQMRSYSFRLITGNDNARFWTTKEVWDKVLHNVNAIVSTPQILLDALSHAFFSLETISLLVFDEAHHCMRNNPANDIMKRYYHPLKDRKGSIPHILGLTATAISNRPKEMYTLEANMDATCCSPTRQIVEYKLNTHKPRLEHLTFHPSDSEPSKMLQALTNVINKLTIDDDPRAKWLQAEGSLQSRAKLEKMHRLGYTPLMKEIRSFRGHVQEVERCIGTWSAEMYAIACVTQLQKAIERRNLTVTTFFDEEAHYAVSKLEGVLSTALSSHQHSPQVSEIGPKARIVLEYLLDQFKATPTSSVIIFVERRSIAFALTQLLQEHPTLQRYGVFSFIGATSFRKRGLVDLMDAGTQQEAFAGFRNGTTQICVATPAMEEGIDVQAVDTVIRFDIPTNFRSYVQGRGRARHRDSRLVMLFEDNAASGVVKDWHALEAEMKSLYEDTQRIIADREAIELLEGEVSEVYRVPATGAVLTYSNARQHLDHFCSTLPSAKLGRLEEAIVLISGTVGQNVTAQIRLPSCVAPNLQVTDSLRVWKSEKNATKDAAFRCYRKLHLAGVVNDHLLPFQHDSPEKLAVAGRESICDIAQAIDPWETRIGPQTPSMTLKTHLLTISTDTDLFPSFLIVTPTAIDFDLEFDLRSTRLGKLRVRISPMAHELEVTTQLALAVNNLLFSKILGRKLGNLSNMEDMPYLIIPNMSESKLRDWLSKVSAPPVPLADIEVSNIPDRQSCLIRHPREKLLYRWNAESIPDITGEELTSEATVSAHRLTKQMCFLDARNKPPTDTKRLLLRSACQLEALPSEYGETMIFIPSIMYMFGIALRAQQALRMTPLSKVGFATSHYIMPALTTKYASVDYNYDRLEFLGDALLKFYTSIHLFFTYPMLPEGVLHVRRSNLISNSRLQKITRGLHLDGYITIENFSGHDWSLAARTADSQPRKVSSKTLADVIEALLGAAFLDSSASMSAALSVFFPKEKWKTLGEYLSAWSPDAETQIGTAQLGDVENMLQYRFRHKKLLAEALTKTSLRPGISSYERLEFLGDAILDRIVSAELFDKCVTSDSDALTVYHHALVNEGILNYLAMTCTRQVTQYIPTTSATGSTTITEHVRIVRLTDHIATVLDRAQSEQRDRASTTYLSVCNQIDDALRNSKVFPWTLLRSIDTPKMYGDIVESIIGAVYIDSNGDFEVCKALLSHLGLMSILERFIKEPDLDPLTPLAKVYIRCPGLKIDRKHSGHIGKGTKKWSSRLSLGEQELGFARSVVSQSHADCVAAEAALEFLSGVSGPLSQTDGGDKSLASAEMTETTNSVL